MKHKMNEKKEDERKQSRIDLNDIIIAMAVVDKMDEVDMSVIVIVLFIYKM